MTFTVILPFFREFFVIFVIIVTDFSDFFVFVILSQNVRNLC